MSASFSLNGKILELGARFNSVALCKFAYGHADTLANSRAVRIAFEHKSYEAAGYMLGRAAEGVVPNPLDFRLGPDWDRANAIAKTDKRAGELMEKYERDAERNFDELMTEVGFKPLKPL